MNALNDEEFSGFKLFSDMLSNKSALTEKERMLVSSFIANCISDRSFIQRFNKALPKILEQTGNDPNISNAAMVVLEIVFRTRRSDEINNFIDKAFANYQKLKANV